jgi:excisionase family DNA binding protein
MAKKQIVSVEVPSQLLSVKQVAKLLNYKESTIYKWAQDGKIPVIRIGRTWRFRRGDLDAWLENRLNGDGDIDLQKVDTIQAELA